MSPVGSASELITAHCVVLCISDSISVDHDSNGKAIESLLHERGHDLVYRRIIKNRPEAIKEAIGDALAEEQCDFIVTTGGTGFSRKDVTVKVLTEIYDEELPGFGELFRSLIFQELGSTALRTHAAAGLIEGRPVFSLPGSPTAAKIGMELLILPEIGALLVDLAH